MKINTKDKIKRHIVLRRIKYRSGLPGEEYINPDKSRNWGTDGPTMEHLEDASYALIRRLGYIKPVKGATNGKNS